jgi:choline dehydrogenase-like flavoprotein
LVTLANDAQPDVIILRQALKKVRSFANFSPLKELLGTESAPGSSVQTDEEWENYVRTSVTTEFHPGCTCAMLPKDKGGVVDAALKVYGTSNVRVIDGSVFPLSMSAHVRRLLF